MHSLFGASKVAADVLVQEYGRYFGLPTVCFRGGCLTGPNHSGAELHGFLAYLARAAKEGRTYRIFGYKGKQVRDNIHSDDVCAAIMAFAERPSRGAVYNLGGGRDEQRLDARGDRAASRSCIGRDARDRVRRRGRGAATTSATSPTSRRFRARPPRVGGHGRPRRRSSRSSPAAGSAQLVP